MADKAGINRSLNTIRTELEYLRDSGVVSPPQFQSIMAQLPVAYSVLARPMQPLTIQQQQGGLPSQYIDPRYAPGGNYASPTPVAEIAQASQDPNHPANPSHPKHGQWASKLGAKLGNAAIFGAGATMGSDLVNSII